MNTVHPKVADNSEREHRQRRRRRAQLGIAAFAAFIGLTSFYGVAGKPRFETYHRLDVIRLMTAGAGFGVALVALFQPLKASDSSSDAKKE